MEHSKQNLIIAGTVILFVLIVLFVIPGKEADHEVAPIVSTTTGEAEEALGSAPTIPSIKTGGTPATSPVVSPPPAGKTYKEFVRPTGFFNTNILGLLNTNEFKLRDFVGKKVILLNFWTTSSMNSMRMFPYLNQWHEKYFNKGLLIISIHTPRFAFERPGDIISNIALNHNVIHPIVLDNNFETWNAYGSMLWPTQYLIDINGKIAHTHAGEGAYESTEAKIQQLLVARAEKLGLKKDIYEPFETPAGIEPVDLTKVKSSETYFGSLRNQPLANGIPLKEGSQDMKPVTDLKSGLLYLTGSWKFTPEYAENMIENGRIIFKYNAKNVYAVFGALKMIRVKVLLDGAPLGDKAGKDIRVEKGESYLYVSEERIYDVVKGGSYGEHTLEFVIEVPGFQAFTLMFG